jgi:hypothetical protein
MMPPNRCSVQEAGCEEVAKHDEDGHNGEADNQTGAIDAKQLTKPSTRHLRSIAEEGANGLRKHRRIRGKSARAVDMNDQRQRRVPVRLGPIQQ